MRFHRAGEQRVKGLKRLDPKRAVVEAQRGQVAFSEGRLRAAVTCFRRSLIARPLVDVYILLGRALRELAEKGSVEAFRAALAMDPLRVDAHNGLGLSLVRDDRLPEAIDVFLRALELDPASANARFNLATTFAGLGRHDAAAVHFGALVATAPGDAEVQAAYGVALERSGRVREAIVAYRNAGSDAAALYNLARLLVAEGELDEAEIIVDSLLTQPLAVAASADALDLRAGILSVSGRVDEAIDEHQRAVEADPTRPELHSNLLLAMQYGSGSREQLFEAHRDWGRRHGSAGGSLATPLRSFGAASLPRLGFVSSDLRYHSVAYFIEPLFRGLTRRASIFAYSNSSRRDATTERLRAHCSGWREVATLDDRALQETLLNDSLDVLIDLSGHTGGNRLRALGCRPAVRIVTYLGYPDTTGLPFDLRITDALADPPGAEHFHTEGLARLEGGFLCYRPDDDAPETVAPPCLLNGFVTFGSFNTTSKLTPGTVALWARVLTQTGGRLILKAPSFGAAATVRRYRSMFEHHGIAPSRVEFHGFVASTREHLARYGSVDIALDPFPYVGTTTTCEAAWMGVPVVSLVGERHAARVGLSLLTRLGLAELAVSSEDDYVRCASELAGDIERLVVLRRELRPRMAASPLCDEGRFAEEFLAAVTTA